MHANPITSVEFYNKYKAIKRFRVTQLVLKLSRYTDESKLVQSTSWFITWWFIMARRHIIHKWTSSFGSPKLTLEWEGRLYIEIRFCNLTDWCGFRVPPWRSIASDTLCLSVALLLAVKEFLLLRTSSESFWIILNSITKIQRCRNEYSFYDKLSALSIENGKLIS